MSLSNAYETHVLNWLLTTGSATRPTGWFVGLFTSDPGEANSGSEVSGNGYERMDATFSVSGDSAENTNTIEFPAATGNWGTITHFVIFTSKTGGTRIAHGSLQTSKAINLADVGRFVPGTLTVTID